MKKIEQTIDRCKQCPFYKTFGRRNAPGCKHPEHHLQPFSVKPLSFTEGPTDPYNGVLLLNCVGVIPDWCPLPDA